MAEWRPGDRIGGRWEVVRILRGGMGVVYIVYDLEWREPFAAKTFQADVLRRSPDVAARFEREALVWIGMEAHPNIADARLFERVDGQPLLFIEFVSGGDLATWIGAPRLVDDLRTVLRLAIQFCDGMTHAAERRLIAHRDVKPANCLLTADGALKITDFGLAKALDGIPLVDLPEDQKATLALAKSAESRTGFAAGTPPYMAPEQFEDVKHVDARADVYAFGVMLFEMLSGRRPFEGRSFPDFAWLHHTKRPPRLTNVPAQLADVVDRCLAKQREERFADFAGLRASLVDVWGEQTADDPPQPATGRVFDAQRLNNKGLSLLHLGRVEEAIDAFDRAVEKNPDAAITWCNKAAALGEELGLWDEALACCDRALEIDDRIAMAWVNRSMALRAMGRAGESEASCARAIGLDPTNAAAWSNRANALKDLGRVAAARDAVDRAIELEPQRAESWSNKGVILGAFGEWDEALSCHETALHIQSDDARLWTNKGQALLALKRHDDAIVALDRALSLRPRLNVALLNKAAALRASGRGDEAVTCLEKVVAIDPGYAPAWANLGNAMLECDRLDDALRCYDRALEIRPEHGLTWFNKGAALLRGMRLDEALQCLEVAARYGVAQAEALADRIRAASR